MSLFPVKDYFNIIKLLLTPDEILEGVEDIQLEAMYLEGYRTILMDIDGTIVPREENNLSLQHANWIDTAQSLGFRLYLISNNSSKRRITRICKQTNLEGIYFAMKPLSFCTKDFMKTHYVTPEKTIFVGDQLLTDVIVGKWCKLYTILVDPLGKNLSFLKTLQRDVEIKILKFIQSI
jgi:HAD superfamily phosphatase (TIGR01668 family)